MLQQGSMSGWALAVPLGIQVCEPKNKFWLSGCLFNFQAAHSHTPPAVQRLLWKTSRQMLCRSPTRRSSVFVSCSSLHKVNVFCVYLDKHDDGVS